MGGWCSAGRRSGSSSLLPPGTVQQLDLSQPLADHGGEDQSEEDTADQHVVVIIVQHVELLGGVDPSLIDIQAVRHHLGAHRQGSGLQAAGSLVHNNAIPLALVQVEHK